VLGIKFMALYEIGNCSNTELHCQP
jgi:hypothetical protein